MKELSIEEKARAYDEALAKARNIVNSINVGLIGKDSFEAVFPELKEESEDERIRKKIIATIHLYYGEPLEDEAKEMIDWLEKQGKYNIGISEATKQKLEDNLNKALEKETPESWNKFIEKQVEQNPADYENPNIQQNDFAPKSAMEAIKEEKVDNANKVEQKFKEGDWVVYQNQTFQVTKNSGNNLILQGRRYQTYFIEELCKPWTIDHAKEGDVLACPNDAGDRDVVFIFKNINSDEGWVFCFCASDANGCFCTNNDYVGNSNSTNISPATKEQRDLLFQKMKDAGYEWDAEKKELKKIEHNPAEWSEMDEEYLNNAIYACLNQYGNISVTAIWLKSIKDRVQPKSVEWSEKDERLREYCINAINGIPYYSPENKQELVGWLKSLRPQNWTKEDKERYISCLQRLGTGNPKQPETINSKWFKEHVYPQSNWKPSEEQMKALNEVLNFAANHESSHWNDYIFGTLNNLIRQLKKLREE